MQLKLPTCDALILTMSALNAAESMSTWLGADRRWQNTASTTHSTVFTLKQGLDRKFLVKYSRRAPVVH